MVIADTSVLVDFLRGRMTLETGWLKHNASVRRIGITSLILCEILQGIRSEEMFAETLSLLEQFEVLDTGSQALAIASARNHRSLRGAGITIRNTIDCLIATFCIEEGHTLLHNDRDFSAFESHLGLQVVHPSADPLN
jgi:predicted nucleic acid-binding protein